MPYFALSCVQQVRELGVLDQRLARDAADVEADAAPVLLLDDGDLLAQLRRADRRDVATGTSTEHHDIEISHGDSLSGGRGPLARRGRPLLPVTFSADLHTRMTGRTYSAFVLNSTTVNGIPALWTEGPPPYTAALVVRAGAQDETVRTSGVGHLVEHLVMTGQPLYHPRRQRLGRRRRHRVPRDGCSRGGHRVAGPGLRCRPGPAVGPDRPRGQGSGRRGRGLRRPGRRVVGRGPLRGGRRRDARATGCAAPGVGA